jgi:hypothetical protein
VVRRNPAGHSANRRRNCGIHEMMPVASRSRFLIALCWCNIAVAAWCAEPNIAASELKRPTNELVVLGGGADLRKGGKSSFAALQARFAANLVGDSPFQRFRGDAKFHAPVLHDRSFTYENSINSSFQTSAIDAHDKRQNHRRCP